MNHAAKPSTFGVATAAKAADVASTCSHCPKCVMIFCRRASCHKPFLYKLAHGLTQWLGAFRGNRIGNELGNTWS